VIVGWLALLVVAGVLTVAATYRTPSDPQHIATSAAKSLRRAERTQRRMRALKEKPL
jgi:hypothetical protein